jgi:hypothetical protein
MMDKVQKHNSFNAGYKVLYDDLFKQLCSTRSIILLMLNAKVIQSRSCLCFYTRNLVITLKVKISFAEDGK